MWDSRSSLAALGIFFAACATDATDATSTDTEELGGASATLAATGELEAVVNIGNCTGTLISQDTVLTASHCVCGTSGTYPATNCATTKTVTFTNVLPIGGSVRQNVSVIADVMVHPDFNNGGWLVNDYTLLRLRTRADQLVQVAPLRASSRLPAIGETDMLVGYGGAGATCDGTFGTKRKGTTVLDAIVTYGGSAGRTLTYDDTLVHDCPGDSGGPTISTATNQVLGVSSSSDMSTNSNYDPTSEAWPWIRANACTASDAAASAATCREGPALATAYRDASFGGVHQSLGAGRWQVADLAELGNDTLSSLSVAPGALVRLWSEGSCWGDSETFTDSVASVDALMNNRTSCIEVAPGATLYANASFGGAKQTLAAGGYNHTQLGAIGNDNAESIVVAPGLVARLCSESGAPGTAGWGTCQDFAGSVATLGGLANTVSNVEIAPAVTVYRGTDFTGVSQTFRPGAWGASSLDVVGNDQIASLVVGPGLQARVCSENGGWGDCQTYTGAVSRVTAILVGRISNIEITAL